MSRPNLAAGIPYFQNNAGQIKQTITIIVGFWLVYYLCYLLEAPLHSFLARYIRMQSEYTMGEQLSKLYLFIVMLISVLAFGVSNRPTKIKLGISFLVLSLVLYVSESNMITEKTQPIFGLIIVACTAVLFLRLRSWLSLTLFLVGFALICGGSLSDMAHEIETIGSLLPTSILQFLDIVSEERFETTGIAFLCLSAIVSFRVPLWDFIEENTTRSLLMLFASGMIAFGNGFLHYESRPSTKFHFVAMVMTIIGFLVLIFANKSTSKKDAILTLVTEDSFYLFIFFFFVVLPSIHGRARHATSLLLWLPSMLFMAVYLWRCHPAHHTGANRSKRPKGSTERAGDEIVAPVPWDTLVPSSVYAPSSGDEPAPGLDCTSDKMPVLELGQTENPGAGGNPEDSNRPENPGNGNALTMPIGETATRV